MLVEGEFGGRWNSLCQSLFVPAAQAEGGQAYIISMQAEKCGGIFYPSASGHSSQDPGAPPAP